MKKENKLKELVNGMSLKLLQISYFIIESDDNEDAMKLLADISDTQTKIFNIVYEVKSEEGLNEIKN